MVRKSKYVCLNYVWMRVCVFVCVLCTYVGTYVRVHVYICIYVCMCVYMCRHMCEYVMHVHVCVWEHRERRTWIEFYTRKFRYFYQHTAIT
jgi:hypothetical protein